MKTIDGRKAEITNPDRRFPHYVEFANKHGYHNAAVPPDYRDTRQRPIEGDIVTLLTSGLHLSGYRGETLWIVEAANGERHIIRESGMRILGRDIRTLSEYYNGVTSPPSVDVPSVLQQLDGLTEAVAKLTLKNAELQAEVTMLRGRIGV